MISPGMKQLTLIRHAKSDHAASAARDFDRPLSLRGLRDAPLIGKYLRDKADFELGRVLTSPALRTVTTANLILQEMGQPVGAGLPDARIYEAPGTQLAEVLQEIPDSVSHAVMIGHNPGLEELTNWLCGRSVLRGLRTGGMVFLRIAGTWNDLHEGVGTLQDYVYPAMIGGGKEGHGY